MLPLILENYDNGDCYGVSDKHSIDERDRLCLGKKFLKPLNGITYLWQYCSLKTNVLILCPPQNQAKYEGTVKDYIDSLDNHKQEFARCKYIDMSSPYPIDIKHRIKLNCAGVKQVGAKPGSKFVIIGRGLWFEVWPKKDWLECFFQSKA